jgi:hypothetical protein
VMRITLSANWSPPVPADARVMRDFYILVY